MTPPKRILLVSYHFGEGSETGGFRWTRMVEDLVRFGWSFDVVTVERPGAHPVVGDPDTAPRSTVEVFPVPPTDAPERVQHAALSLVRRVLRRRGADVAAVTSSARSASSAAELASAPSTPSTASSPSTPPRELISQVSVWKPGDVTALRARVAKAIGGAQHAIEDRVWVSRAVAVAMRLARSRRHAAVVVSSPPHASQLVGAAVARATGLPFVADYRDPWVLGLGVQRPVMNVVSRMLGARWERIAQAHASVVVHNTRRAAEVIETLAPGRARRREAVANGYDTVASVARPDPDVFRVLYGGWLHPYMDVRHLLAACARFRERHAPGAGTFRVEFLGTGASFGGVPLLDLAGAYGLGDVTELAARVPRAEALARQHRASVLAAFDYPHGIAVVMKFYDYAQMYGSLLLIGNPDGALAEAAGRIGARVHAPTDLAAIDATLDAAYARWRARDWPHLNDREGVHRRAARSAEMHAILESVSASAGATPGS